MFIVHSWFPIQLLTLEVDTVIDDLRLSLWLNFFEFLNLKVFKTSSLCDMSMIQFYDFNILNFYPTVYVYDSKI